MSQTGLGVALRKLREKRTLSLRETSQLTTVDHAYIHRLETGEKISPSEELIGKLLKVYKPDARDATLVKWLIAHPEANPEVISVVLDDPSIDIDIGTAAASMFHRGNVRPDPATLITRVRNAFKDE